MNPANVSVDEAVAFLDRFPDVEAIDLILYDGNGVGRGKIIRRAELVHVFEQGVSLPASILGQEVCGEDVDCLLYTSPSPRDVEESRMPSSA